MRIKLDKNFDVRLAPLLAQGGRRPRANSEYQLGKVSVGPTPVGVKAISRRSSDSATAGPGTKASPY